MCVCVCVCSAPASPKSAEKLAFSWTHLLTTAPGTPAVNSVALRAAGEKKQTLEPLEMEERCTLNCRVRKQWKKKKEEEAVGA